MTRSILDSLEHRIGRIHLRQRLGLEAEHEARILHRGINFFHLENWYSIHSFIRNTLRLVGLHGVGRRNALDIQVRQNTVQIARLPSAFENFTLLHLSDLHLDMNDGITDAIIARVRDLEYNLCVLTGDYRYKTFGPYDNALAEMAHLRSALQTEVYGVLGNHDTIRFVPGLEALGFRMLLNESVTIERAGSLIHLAGIDDAHYYQVDNIQKVASSFPADAVSILLSHTPETYKQAAHAGFDLMLSGHTHGGQICLPGGVPILTDADCPRRFAKGPWRYHHLAGYTSVGAGSSIVDVRLNCRPEITLHTLKRGAV